MLHKSYIKKIVNENIHKLLVNEINNKSYVCETRETQYSIWKKFGNYIELDPYDGIDNKTRTYLDENNIDGYSFPIECDGYDTECIVLKDKSKIISIEKKSNQ